MEVGFVLKAILAGIGIAFVAGPLGCFLLWRKLAYFGDTLAHSALFGIAISLFLHINNYIGLIISCLLVVSALALISASKKISYDSILGILSHTTLAIGLVAISLIQNVKVDLLGYLYGDILTITNQDLCWVFSIDIFVLILLKAFWRKLINITVSKDLAKVEGIPTEIFTWVLFLLMALVFAIAVKLVGVLLVTALLIVPGASARFISRSPEQMAVYAIILGSASVLLGMEFSLQWNWPTGPAIVIVSALFFSFIFLLSFLKKRFKQKAVY